MLKLSSSARVAVMLAVAVSAASTYAEDKLIPPPYVLTGLEVIATGVTWDEAMIKSALPPGVTPAREMTGGINIYKVGAGYVLGSYSAAYLWVDLEGLDSSDGTKGRWMLAGVYSSQKVRAVIQEFFGLPIREGTARLEASAGKVRAVGSTGGRDLVAVDVKIDANKCAPGGGGVSYLSRIPRTGHFIVLSDAFWGEVCPAEVDSVRVIAPEGDPFAQFQPKRINWSVQFKGSVAVTPPIIRP